MATKSSGCPRRSRRSSWPSTTSITSRSSAGSSPARPSPPAQAELDRIARDLRGRFPQENLSRGLGFQPLLAALVGDYRTRLFLLLGAVAFVLLIACANIAGLLLARSASRARETAIRAAVGAGRRHIVRQALTESLCWPRPAVLAGIALAYWGVGASWRSGRPMFPASDWRGWTVRCWRLRCWLTLAAAWSSASLRRSAWRAASP